ncbi:hypothetical protein V6N12_000243 [Hibiscus sabdariffa]|uniref:Uncharacterized protein n=1 Tax=Hibiscus sabdariffa TaxID=183260 RepID=A0ABR2ASQ8_9ROSI
MVGISGENANHAFDSEKVIVLITTNHATRTEELVELEIDNLVHEVYVCEIGFKDETFDPLYCTVNSKAQVQSDKVLSDRLAELLSEHVHRPQPETVGCNVDMEKEAINEMNIGKEYGFNCGDDSENSFRFIREKDLIGNSSLLHSSRRIVGIKEQEAHTMGKSVDSVQVGFDSVPTKAMDDVGFMGLCPVLNVEDPISNISKHGRAEAASEFTIGRDVPEAGVNTRLLIDKTHRKSGLNGWKDGRSFFPELEAVDR